MVVLGVAEDHMMVGVVDGGGVGSGRRSHDGRGS